MGSSKRGSGGASSTSRWLVVIGVVSLVGLLYVLVAGVSPAGKPSRLRTVGADVGASAVQRQLNEQAQLVVTAQQAAESCRTQFQVRETATVATRAPVYSGDPAVLVSGVWRSAGLRDTSCVVD